MIKTENLGMIEYAQAWDYQRSIFDKVLNREQASTLLLCEHPHVYTLGKNGKANNLLISPDFLNSIRASYFEIDRGGDITYHGLGQIVGYPILNLKDMGIGIKEYVHKLEQALINTVRHYDIIGERIDGAAGVWVKSPNNTYNKIAAIGIKASRFVTMHGFALNVNTDLSYFNHINPCGFTDKGVCSIQSLTGSKIDIEEVKQLFTIEFLSLFQ